VFQDRLPDQEKRSRERGPPPIPSLPHLTDPSGLDVPVDLASQRLLHGVAGSSTLNAFTVKEGLLVTQLPWQRTAGPLCGGASLPVHKAVNQRGPPSMAPT